MTCEIWNLLSVIGRSLSSFGQKHHTIYCKTTDHVLVYKFSIFAQVTSYNCNI